MRQSGGAWYKETWLRKEDE